MSNTKIGTVLIMFTKHALTCYIFRVLKNIQEVCASLPSLFHLEVLLMDFHSSNAFEKIKMAKNIFSTLSNVSCPPVELNSTQLVFWSLLTAHNIHTNLINHAKK